MAVAAPAVSLYRPQTTPVVSKGASERRGRTPAGKARSSKEGYSNRELHDVMENDYEWPDLPPIEQIKDAISRQRVSQGVSYILPVDKTKSSVENVYRTNLRVMFQDPYAADRPGEYDENQVRVSTKHHFLPNAVPTAYKRNMHADPRLYEVNAESEKVRASYAKSAPSTGQAARRSLTNNELKQRSNLYLPLKAKIPEEAQKLKDEADKILRSVQERDEEYDPSKDKVVIPSKASVDALSSLRKDRQASRVKPGKGGHARRARISIRPTPDKEGSGRPLKKTEQFESYEDLKKTSVPKIRHMPEYVQDLEYLTDEKKTDIWSWLNKGDEQTDFTYFMEVCS